MHDTNDPRLRSWVEVPAESDFPIQNLPYGVFRDSTQSNWRVGIAIGEHVLDLAGVHDARLFAGTPIERQNVFALPELNELMARERPVWTSVRNRISELLRQDCEELRHVVSRNPILLLRQDQVELKLPVDVRNFVDFYSFKDHAFNVGTMFRGADNALMPNWLHLPVGYNGRASSIVVSGVDVRRPRGQTKADDADAPTYGPSRLLDFELEVGFLTGMGNPLGTQIPAARASEHIFGLVLVNDWSARDIQKWEYVPLGPFLGKSFATSISPWVVPLEALEPYRTESPTQNPPVLDYLKYDGNWSFDIHLEAYLQTEQMEEPHRIVRSNYKYMYWNMAQQLAHVTVNGTNIMPGDLYASGTASGPDEESRACMLERSWKGTRPLRLPNGEERKFLHDGDRIEFRGWCGGKDHRIGFGSLTSKILPAE